MDPWHDPESAFPWTARMSLWCCFEISTCFRKPYGCYRCQRPFNSSAKGFFFPSKYSLVPKQKYSWNLHPQLCDAGNEEAITWMLHSTASQITSRGEALFIPAGSDPCQLSQDLHIHLDTRKLHWCFTHYLICNWKNPEPSRANHTGVLDCKMTCECWLKYCLKLA